jgi:DNA adenine methylase
VEHAKTIKNWTFTDYHFSELRNLVSDEDFIYADPPYYGKFTAYSSGGFTWEEHEELAQWLSKHKGPVVISNHAEPEVLKLYEKNHYSIKHIDAPRFIACDGNRRLAKEILATRNL